MSEDETMMPAEKEFALKGSERRVIKDGFKAIEIISHDLDKMFAAGRVDYKNGNRLENMQETTMWTD